MGRERRVVEALVVLCSIVDIQRTKEGHMKVEV